MSVVAIIVVVVVVVAILAALFAFMPRIRERGRVRRRELELGQRRKQAVSEQREQADQRARQAEMAEQRARIAEQEARRERAEAELHQERATMHEEGMADHELIEDHEREHFAGTSAVPAGAVGEGVGDPAPEGGAAGPERGTVDYEDGRQGTPQAEDGVAETEVQR